MEIRTVICSTNAIESLKRPLPQGRAGTGTLPNRAGRVEVSVPCDKIPRPDRPRKSTMDHALETSSQRIRHHLRRPLAGSRDVLMKTAGNTVSETDPLRGQALILRRGAGP